MGDDRQTYSGRVRTWECDTKEHFTVAYYYYQRFSQATYRLLLEMGWDFKEQYFPASTDCYTRFLQELNQGDSFEIRSGVIESDSQSMKVGHKLINSETGELCTTMEQMLNEGPKINMKSL
ncbi:MAG: thioesterase family protein [SAR324 cluster bacterium]|nr:thioesterase family protein [SAR324 cluster bacterium]